MKRILASLILSVALTANAGIATPFGPHDDWTDEDTAFQAAQTAMLYMDYRQTRQIYLYPDLHELNPILGPHPSAIAIRNHFISIGLLDAGIAYVLPSPWRRRFQLSGIVFEGWVVHHNAMLGLQIPF